MMAEILPVGDEGLLVEVGDLDAVLALDAVLRSALVSRQGPWRQVTDVVPGARTVLLVARPGADLRAVAEAVRALVDTASGAETAGPTSSVTEVVEIAVRYDGPDLDDVARHTGLSPQEVVRAHTGTHWRVAFGGFAPGFGYLVGGDPRLHVPRRETPRARVPAGAVGLAGEFAGVYPRSSPGGWQLLGTTDAVLWDPDRDPPALLTPGTAVRFVEVRERR